MSHDYMHTSMHTCVATVHTLALCKHTTARTKHFTAAHTAISPWNALLLTSPWDALLLAWRSYVVLHNTRQLTNHRLFMHHLHLPTTRRNIRSVVLLNLQSYAGGINLFGRKKGYQVPESGDTLLEIVGFKSTPHIGCVISHNKCGLRAVRLGQASVVHLQSRARLAMQIDGEPWLQPECSVSISLHNQASVLVG